MKYTYKEVTNYDGVVTIQAAGEDGSVLFIPKDDANSDYQRYLNKDKPEAALSTPIVVEHLTESVTKAK